MKSREQKDYRECTDSDIMNRRLIQLKEYDRSEDYKRNLI